jgi:hypothetical protein
LPDDGTRRNNKVRKAQRWRFTAASSRAQRFATPLPTPAFGAPYGGQQCSSCGRWFDRRHFERTRRGLDGQQVFDHHVARCSNCIQAGRRRRESVP